MSCRRVNVLVYTGTGTTTESVRHAITTLRRLLIPNYAVNPLTESALLKEPWLYTCALLVIPGGADRGYCRFLNGAGNRRIAEFVRRGGAYLGLCAGGYYGSARCEFGPDGRDIEINERRELAFFPGTCRGSAYPGFRYDSEAGARAVPLKIETTHFAKEMGVPANAVSYCNGGGVFVDAKKLGDHGVEVLASYAENIAVDGGDGKAAVVYCKIGEGAAILSGPHPEFAAGNLRRKQDDKHYDRLIDSLTEHDNSRSAFFKGCLRKLGLEVGDKDTDVPSLSRMHLSSMKNTEAEDLLLALADISLIERRPDGEFIRAENDTFCITRFAELPPEQRLRLPGAGNDDGKGKLSANGDFIDYSGVLKHIIAHERAWPDAKVTPDFQHDFYYRCLEAYQLMEACKGRWGRTLLYGEVLTSTSTILYENPKLVTRLPTGFTVTATSQVAARGRGSNIWVCPRGSLLFSTIINIPAALSGTRPIWLLQHLAGIAIVEAVKTYDMGYYSDIPIRMKWPNDVCAMHPDSDPSNPTWAKVAGILSTCSYMAGSYTCVLGIGLNVNNPRPTTSLNAILPKGAAPFRLEKLLARILARLESCYEQFIRDGFSRDLERRYYDAWLHSGQVVTLDSEGGAKVKIKGIDRDQGDLVTVGIDEVTGLETGRTWKLSSDHNSFDFWKGLIRKRVS